MTRAQDELHLFGNVGKVRSAVPLRKEFQIVEELRNSPGFEVAADPTSPTPNQVAP